MTRRPRTLSRPVVLSAVCMLVSGAAFSRHSSAADWPMWRHDAGRSAASPTNLPDRLHLQWVRELPPLKPAWASEPVMHFDKGYEPVVMGKTMFVCSSRNDTVTAYDTETGEARWVFHTEGPNRFTFIM